MHVLQFYDRVHLSCISLILPRRCAGLHPIKITMIKFKHIRSRYLIPVLVVFIALQLTALVALKLAGSRYAERIAEAQISTGEQLFVSLLQHNTASLKQALQLLAADGVMSEAVSSQDPEVIKFALAGYQNRLHAQQAYFVSLDASQIISTSASVTQAEEDARLAILENQTGTLKFEMIAGRPYQLITLPLKNPGMQGWLVMGFAVDARLATQIKQLTQLDVAFVQKSRDHDWRLVSGTASNDLSNMLVKTMADIYRQPVSLHRLDVNGEVYQIKMRSLHETREEALLVVLQGGVTPWLQLFDRLMQGLLGLTLLGVALLSAIIWMTSRRVTGPLRSLAQYMNALAAGEVTQPLPVTGQDEIDALTTAVGRLQDAVTQRSASTAQLAFDDTVTGLANRLAFDQALSAAVTQHADSQQKLAVLVFNLQRFKQVNQSFGRDFGDALLKHVGQGLKQALPGAQDVVARLEADQFAVLLQQADQAQTTRYADQVQQMFEQPVTVQGQRVDIHAVMGIALYPEHSTESGRLLRQAETALQASLSKRSPWIVYNTALEIEQAETLALVADLKQALPQGQFLMYIQPKIDITTRRALGGEALIRWVHPERGLLMPDQFIAIAEQTGMISALTQWMLQRTCEALATFQKQGLRVSLSVNLTTRDLHDLQLAEQIAHLLSVHGLEAGSLKLEVTERSLMSDPERAQTALRKLSAMGLHIAIDDFGTGYSSLNQLRQLPVQELKIARTFVMFMDKHASDASIVKSVIDLAHNLKWNVVATGIENEQVLNQLSRLGCNEGQGFFIGKPMPEKDFSVWLERWEGQNDIELDIGDELSFDIDPLPAEDEGADPFKLD